MKVCPDVIKAFCRLQSARFISTGWAAMSRSHLVIHTDDVHRKVELTRSSCWRACFASALSPLNYVNVRTHDVSQCLIKPFIINAAN